MKHTYITALLLLATTSSLAWSSSTSDEEAAAKYHQDRAGRLRTRSVLEARAVCTTIDYMEGGDGTCVDAGCEVCGANYYYIGQDDAATLPPLNQMVVLASASDIKGKRAILDNFLEAGQFKDR
jgi:hypothetical protein